jgi:hypothetical protein
MAHHYEPDKMIQLVQLCCWREQTEMTQNGLLELAAKLAPDRELSDRYIVDLLSDARKAQKEGVTVKKNETQISVLLKHVGFNHWDDWKDALRKPGYFLSPQDEDFDLAGEKAAAVVVPRLLETQLFRTLGFVRKSLPIDVVSFHEETLAGLAKYALTLLEKNSVILCALPLSWKEQAVKVRQPAWGEFTGTGRILPVWVESANPWVPVAPFIPSVKQEQSAAGLPGLLTGLIFLENYSRTQLDGHEKNAAIKPGSRASAPQFHHSTVGFYMQGGTVHNLVTGGDQTINNHFD